EPGRRPRGGRRRRRAADRGPSATAPSRLRPLAAAARPGLLDGRAAPRQARAARPDRRQPCRVDDAAAPGDPSHDSIATARSASAGRRGRPGGPARTGSGARAPARARRVIPALPLAQRNRLAEIILAAFHDARAREELTALATPQAAERWLTGAERRWTWA